MSSVFKPISDPTRRKLLREAELVHTEKQGTSITYSLKMSVLEEALMGFTQAFDMDVRRDDQEQDQKGG